MNEQVFKPVENFINDFKFINTFTSGELSKYTDKENESFDLSDFIEDNLNTYYNNLCK